MLAARHDDDDKTHLHHKDNDIVACQMKGTSEQKTSPLADDTVHTTINISSLFEANVDQTPVNCWINNQDIDQAASAIQHVQLWLSTDTCDT